MHDLLRELRAIVEHERALHGDLLPVPPAEDATEAAPSPSPDAPPTETDTPSHAAPDDAGSDPDMPNYDLFGNQVDPAEDPSLPPPERIEALIPDDAPYKDADTLEEVEQYFADNVLVPIDEDRENLALGTPRPTSSSSGRRPDATRTKRANRSSAGPGNSSIRFSTRSTSSGRTSTSPTS